MKATARLKRWRGCRVTLSRSLGLAAYLVLSAVLAVPSLASGTTQKPKPDTGNTP